eukprot:13393903-Heterocapsa_arctica.AAC.1
MSWSLMFWVVEALPSRLGGREVPVSMSSCTKILGAIFDVTADRTADWVFKLEAASSTNRQLRAMCGKAGWVPNSERMNVLHITTLQR